MADDDGSGLTAALDELYGVDPTAFVATRKRLAGELRDAGERDAAKELTAARRPTQAAGLVNQVARADPALVRAFLDASDAVRDAQSATSAGTQADVRAAITAQRGAVAALVIEAAPAEVSDAVRTEVVAIVHAAAVDPGAAELLLSGQLVRVPDAVTGFGDAWSTGGAPAPSRRAASAKGKVKPKSRTKTTDADTSEAEAEAEAEAAAERARAEAARARAQTELDEATAALDASADELAAAEDHVEQAKAEAERARFELADAKRAHSDAGRLVTKRAKALEQADRRLKP